MVAVRQVSDQGVVDISYHLLQSIESFSTTTSSIRVSAASRPYNDNSWDVAQLDHRTQEFRAAQIKIFDIQSHHARVWVGYDSISE
jgi:hypothetical protein